MVQEIAFGRDIIVFAKEETTPGTKEFPGTGDAIFLTGEPTFKQVRNFIPDAQRRATYSKVERIKARLSPGEWSLSTYIKPSGDKGVAPECGQLLEGLFGRRGHGVDQGGISPERPSHNILPICSPDLYHLVSAGTYRVLQYRLRGEQRRHHHQGG